MEIPHNDKECIICFYIIADDQPYCMINNKNERAKLHVECLEQWINKSQNGLYTQDEIKSYSIYQMDRLIETIIIPQNYVNDTTNMNDNIPLLHIDKKRTKKAINENDHVSRNSGCENCCIII